MSMLLSPAHVAGLHLKNRVVMSPMCMYEVKKEDGVLEPFHFVHYGARALSKVGLIIMESTAVDPDGRITKNDLGLWNDRQAQKLGQLIHMIHGFGTQIGVQLNHAGRKAEDAKRPVAPSPITYSSAYRTPQQLTVEQIHQIENEFVAAAHRAQQAGVDMLEIHGAHGYLLNQMLEPATNHRHDQYGGSLQNRYRMLGEIIRKIRQFYHGSLWVRLSVTAYGKVQNSVRDYQQIAQWLERDGVSLIDASTGALLNRKPNIPVYNGYQVPYSMALKRAVKIPVSAVGLLDDPGLCESILRNHQADLILEGRAFLRNTNWLSDAARVLHDHDFKAYNASYQRGQINR